MSRSFGTEGTVQTFSEDSSTGNTVPNKSTAGAPHVNQRDSSGNEITPAFSPGTPYDLTAVAANTVQALGAANSVRIVGKATGDSLYRIKFGNADTVTASNTTDMVLNGYYRVPPEVFTIPASAKDASGNVWMAFIRNSGGGDTTFQVTTG